MDGIFDLAATARLEDVKDLIDRQIDLNTRIAQEGLSGEWGAGVGKVLLDSCADLPTRAKAMAAAGSDARMGGCALPVVINAGSGNQGLTVSLPVITYARAMGASDEALCRALLLSNLVSIHQRTAWAGWAPSAARCAPGPRRARALPTSKTAITRPYAAR
jgi:L-cysteine desulfidase